LPVQSNICEDLRKKKVSRRFSQIKTADIRRKKIKNKSAEVGGKTERKYLNKIKNHLAYKIQISAKICGKNSAK